MLQHFIPQECTWTSTLGKYAVQIHLSTSFLHILALCIQDFSWDSMVVLWYVSCSTMLLVQLIVNADMLTTWQVTAISCWQCWHFHFHLWGWFLDKAEVRVFPSSLLLCKPPSDPSLSVSTAFCLYFKVDQDFDGYDWEVVQWDAGCSWAFCIWTHWWTHLWTPAIAIP